MRASRATGVILVAASVAACGGRDDRELRAAFVEMRDAALRRDYERAWEYLDSGSREAIARQLRKFQDMPESDPAFALSWQMLREQFGLGREDVARFDARQYFLAMLRGLDRVQPELRARQIEETRGRQLVGITIRGTTAEMETRTTSGVAETFYWVKEGTWKCKADVE